MKKENSTENSEKQQLKQSQGKNVVKNYFFNVLYQIFVLVAPLITAPYIARVLQTEKIGQYSFTSSIINFFVLFAALGFGYYAQREIAAKQGDKKQQSIVFWEIIIVRFFSVTFSVLILLLLCLYKVFGEYTELMFYWIPSILAVEFDVTFLFQGNENFKIIVLRNLLIKTGTILATFLLVKTTGDLWIYILITSVGTFFSQASLIVSIPRYLVKVSISELHPAKHIIPTIRLFIPTIAVSVYTILDKTFIGLLVTGQYEETINGITHSVKFADIENGYYEQSEKIVKVFLTILTSLGIVIAPRNSKEFENGEMDRFIGNIYLATNYTWCFGIPLTFGIAAIAPNFIPWFLGQGYDKCINLMQMFAPLVLVIGMSNVYGLQYLIPAKKDKSFTVSILIGAIINTTCNLCLIPTMWSYGAVIGSLIAETSVTGSMIFIARKEISVTKVFKQSINYLFSGFLMFSVIYPMSVFMVATWYNSMIIILCGVISYFSVLLLLKDSFVHFIFMNFLKKVKNPK
jgi:O-antigen/teichoic acid export membrane protein